MPLAGAPSETIVKIKTVISKLEVKLGGSIECPKCEHEFVLDGDREAMLEKLSKSKIDFVFFGIGR